MTNCISCVYVLYDDIHYYVGKTMNLNNRLINHKSNNNTSMSKLLKNDFKYLIIKNSPDINYLNKLEQETYDLYRKLHGDLLVNKKRPLNNGKDYYNQNKSRILTRFKKYRESNKQYFKEYYIKSVKYSHKCDVCNIDVSKYRYLTHIKTNKHIKNLNVKNNIINKDETTN